MSSSNLYFDNAATTRPAPAVLAAMQDVWDAGAGNASALHRPGIAAARAVERARQRVADALGADPAGIVFTAGGTEANNLALKGAVLAAGHRAGHLVVSAVEHPSVLEPARWLQNWGIDLTVLPVDGTGRVDPDDVARALRPDTRLVSVMHANNETGRLQPVADIGALCRRADVLFHVDACQSLGKVPVAPESWGADLVTVNAHKLHGPQGVGALWVRPGVRLAPLLHGGGQEAGLRSGTHAAAAIAGFGAAIAWAATQDWAAVDQRRRRLLATLRDSLPDLRLHGAEHDTLPTILNVGVPGVDGKALFSRLDRAGMAVATGSACASARREASAVLTAMGLSSAQAWEAVRLSLSCDTTDESLDRAARLLIEQVRTLRGE